MLVLHDDARLKITADLNGDGEGCPVFICLTGVGHAMGGVDLQSEEFKKLSKTGGVFYITDKLRSWGNSLDFEFISGLLQPYLENKKVFAVGNSMGGFLCVVLSRYLNLEAAICFSAQFSVDPSVVPEERRWKKYRDSIEVFKYSSFEECVNHDVKYYFFSGSDASEAIHWSRFPRERNILNVVVETSGHGLAAEMKRRGCLYDLIFSCIEGDVQAASSVISDAGFACEVVG